MSPRVALVTGGGRGIGLATARRFLEEGWQVALLDVDADVLARPPCPPLCWNCFAMSRTPPPWPRPSGARPRISGGWMRW